MCRNTHPFFYFIDFYIKFCYNINIKIKFKFLGDKNMAKIQKVVRTTPTSEKYVYDKNTMAYLAALLNEGYTVVMCNHIGKDLEYIVEKEKEES